MHPINALFLMPSVSLRSWKLTLSQVALRRAPVEIFLWFLCCDYIILVNSHCAVAQEWWCRGPCTAVSKRLSSRPDVHLSYYFTSALHPSPFRSTCDRDQGCDAFKAGRGRVFSIVLVGISFSPVKPRLLWWICNEHNLQDVILVLYLSAFVCKLSIMDKKKKPACICSWFCHEMTLPNVWYCFLYLREKSTRLWML